MDAVTLMRQQAAFTEGLAARVIASVTQEQSAWRAAGGTTNPIAATIFHAYHTEDRIVHLAAQGKPTVFEAGGWKERLGVDRETMWTTTAPIDVEQVRAYTKAVHADSVAYLERTDGAGWEREVDGPLGKMTLAALLSLGLVVHKSLHLGDVSACLGVQGAKGLPF